MVTKEQLLIDKLQNIYDRAITSGSSRTFFLALYEYMEVYDTESGTNPINKAIADVADRDSKKLNELEARASEEIANAYKEIKGYIKKKKITDEVVLDEILDYEQTVAGTRRSSNGPTRSKYGSVTYALMTLVEDKEKTHLSFCREFGVISDEGRIQNWNFSPSYKKWEEEYKIIQRLGPTKIWHSWDKLVSFYGLYRDYEKLQDANLEKMHVWDVYGLHMLFKELQSIMDEKHHSSKTPLEYKVEDYKTYLQKVHSYGMEFLLIHQPISPQLMPMTWQYNTSSGTFSIHDKTISFKKDMFRAHVLTLLTSKASNKEWSFGDILKKINGMDMPVKKDMDKVYYACNGINERIAKEALIPDFLLVTTLTVRINPKYL